MPTQSLTALIYKTFRSMLIIITFKFIWLHKLFIITLNMNACNYFQDHDNLHQLHFNHKLKQPQGSKVNTITMTERKKLIEYYIWMMTNQTYNNVIKIY